MSDTVNCSRCGQSYEVGRDAYWTNRALCSHCWAVDTSPKEDGSGDRDSPARGDVTRQATAAPETGTGTPRHRRIRAWLPGILLVCIATAGVGLWALCRVEGPGEGLSATGDASVSPELQASRVALDASPDSQAHPTDVQDAVAADCSEGETCGPPAAATQAVTRYLEDVVRLDELYRQEVRRAPASEGVAKLLLDIAELSRKLEISIEEFQRNPIYREIGHQRIVISGNFGDFVAYDGYHYRMLLKQFPNSAFADDAAYALIYVTPDEYDYDDLRDERKLLRQFVKKYPRSNLRTEATNRINEIGDWLRHGGIGILD